MKAHDSARSGKPLAASVTVLIVVVLVVVMVNTSTRPKVSRDMVVPETATTYRDDAGQPDKGAAKDTPTGWQSTLINQGEAEALVRSDVKGMFADEVSFPMMEARFTTMCLYQQISQSGDNMSGANDPIWAIVFSVTGNLAREGHFGGSAEMRDFYLGEAGEAFLWPDGTTRGLWVLDAVSGDILATSVHPPDDSVELDQILALPTSGQDAADGSSGPGIAEVSSGGKARGPSSASSPLPISAEGTRQCYLPPLATPDPNVSEAARLEHLRQVRPHFICTADEAVAFVQEVTHTTDWVRFVAKRTSLIQLDRWQGGEAPADPATENTPLV